MRSFNLKLKLETLIGLPTACVCISGQGCQMVCFQTKNLNLGKFWWTLEWKMLKCFMAIWNILRTLGIFYDHLVHFMLIWYIFTVLVSCTKKNLATLPQDHFSDLNC
jgi:hypothetical protein